MQCALSPFPDWKGDLFGDHSQQGCFEKVSSLLSAAYPIDQPEKRKIVIAEALFDGSEEA
jgi:hypothetical protein